MASPHPFAHCPAPPKKEATGCLPPGTLPTEVSTMDMMTFLHYGAANDDQDIFHSDPVVDQANLLRAMAALVATAPTTASIPQSNGQIPSLATQSSASVPQPPASVTQASTSGTQAALSLAGPWATNGNTSSSPASSAANDSEPTRFGSTTGSSASAGGRRAMSAPPAGRVLESTPCELAPSGGPQPARPVTPIQSYDVLADQTEFTNAQQAWPGKGCVFVGNLPAGRRSNTELAGDLAEAFSIFGLCVVRVERDINRKGIEMPHALVQFRNIDEAERALKHGASIKLHGRSLRVEISTTRRTINVGFRNGSFIYTGDAIHIMSRFGQIEHVERRTRAGTCSPLGSTIDVTFLTYGAYIQAKRAVQLGHLSNDFVFVI